MKAVRMLTAILFFFTAMAFASKLLVEAQTTGNPMKVIGYFPRYGIYDGFFVKNLITNGSAKRLTHINYAFTNVVNNRCVSFDTYADYQAPVSAQNAVNGVSDSHGGFAGNFHQLQELKKLYPNIKIIMSIGGGSSDPNAFRSAVAPAKSRGFRKKLRRHVHSRKFWIGLASARHFRWFRCGLGISRFRRGPVKLHLAARGFP